MGNGQPMLWAAIFISLAVPDECQQRSGGEKLCPEVHPSLLARLCGPLHTPLSPSIPLSIPSLSIPLSPSNHTTLVDLEVFLSVQFSCEGQRGGACWGTVRSHAEAGRKLCEVMPPPLASPPLPPSTNQHLFLMEVEILVSPPLPATPNILIAWAEPDSLHRRAILARAANASPAPPTPSGTNSMHSPSSHPPLSCPEPCLYCRARRWLASPEKLSPYERNALSFLYKTASSSLLRSGAPHDLARPWLRRAAHISAPSVRILFEEEGDAAGTPHGGACDVEGLAGEGRCRDALGCVVRSMGLQGEVAGGGVPHRDEVGALQGDSGAQGQDRRGAAAWRGEGSLQEVLHRMGTLLGRSGDHANSMRALRAAYRLFAEQRLTSGRRRESG